MCPDLYATLLRSLEELLLRGIAIVIVHFTVVYLVTWPLSESETGVDRVLVQTALLFTCK